MIIKKIVIEGLFGYKNYEIKLKNNRLIIVAENGAGKTTILKIIYYLLSKQWEELNKIVFETIIIHINELEIKILRKNLLQKKIEQKDIEEIIKKFPTYETSLKKILKNHDYLSLKSNPQKIKDLTENHDIRPGLLNEIVDQLVTTSFRHLNEYEWEGRILFFPTYRKLETDFHSLYPDFDERIKNKFLTIFPEIKQKDANFEGEIIVNRLDDLNNIFTNLWKSYHEDKRTAQLGKIQFFEAIEFGMDDVKVKIQAIQKEIKNNKIIAEKLKKQMSKFLFVCNKYLIGEKEIAFENEELIFKDRGQKAIKDINQLASGEQQILSIFAAIYLSTSNLPTFVIIDEPEISLSIEWQEKLLVDILGGNCNGIIAATHSPFIYDNELEHYMYPLDDFIKNPKK